MATNDPLYWYEFLESIKDIEQPTTRVAMITEAIPIIFVPGIMGSRLKNQDGEKIWDPDSMWFMLSYLWKEPFDRKSMLIGKEFNPDFLDVSEDDAKHNKKFYSESDTDREDRGWGGVAWKYYGKLIMRLQNHDWNKPVKPSKDKDKRKSSLPGLFFEYPVYAFGYNWTDDNDNSGKRLAAKIKEIKEDYASEDRPCKYVILVSHSMGGLVCRAACKLYGADEDVLGVIHGVQPAVGAAAAYWRMKGGFESGWITAKVLGPDGPSVTCVLGNAPGGLELLPTRDYETNDGKNAWLTAPVFGNSILETYNLNLPVSDPYDEIYKLQGNLYYRLVNPDWLDPKEKSDKPVISSKRKTDNPWKKYIKCLDKARDFHENLKTHCHQPTYQFYYTGKDTIDRISFKRDKKGWFNEASSEGKCVMYVDSLNREIPLPLIGDITHVLKMSKFDDNGGGGDGTVSTSSGKSLEKKCLYSQEFRKVDHSDVYNEDDAIDFVITCIRKLALERIRIWQKENK